jgi:hypothetical protein
LYSNPPSAAESALALAAINAKTTTEAAFAIFRQH